MKRRGSDYPPQTGAYIVRLKQAGTNWQDYDTARLEISVGQDYHTGEKLKAEIEWAKARFDRVVILVNDTLQRFNLVFEDGLLPEEAFTRALSAGDEWIDAHSDLFAGCELVRWEEWLAHPGYQATRAQCDDLYHGNEAFREALYTTIESVWHRRSGSGSYREGMNRQDFFDLSLEYLLEETACLALAYRDYPGISFYPGTFLDTWNMFIGRDTPGVPEGLKYAFHASIDFRKNRSAPPPAP